MASNSSKLSPITCNSSSYFIRDYAIRELNVIHWLSLIAITVLLLTKYVKLFRLWIQASRIPGPHCPSFFGHSKIISRGNLIDAGNKFLYATEAIIAKFRDSQVSYVVETFSKTSGEAPQPVIVSTARLYFHTDPSIEPLGEVAQLSDASSLPCAHFCQENRSTSYVFSAKNTDILQVTVLLNRSGKSPQSIAPVAGYFSALEEVRFVVVDLRLEILCYAARDIQLGDAISRLIIPGLVDQLNSMKCTMLRNLLAQHRQLRPYHFCPPGVLHPMTVIYELSYEEIELKQDGSRSFSSRKGSSLLKDVHIGIPGSGVSGGTVSLVQGSYEYYDYLQNGFDDSGWGCAYCSIQTIISWFRLQHYTTIDVPSHREIQQALVAIGDEVQIEVAHYIGTLL